MKSDFQGRIRYNHRYSDYKKTWITCFYTKEYVISAFVNWIGQTDFKNCRAFFEHKLIARQATYTGV